MGAFICRSARLIHIAYGSHNVDNFSGTGGFSPFGSIQCDEPTRAPSLIGRMSRAAGIMAADIRATIQNTSI
jgi:hypothetical protein